MSKPSFPVQFTNDLDPQCFRQIARDTKWCQRKAKIDPFEFLNAAVFSHASASRMTLVAQVQGLGDPVTRQAIDQRYNGFAVDFFKASFAHCLRQRLSPDQCQAQALAQHFSSVFLLDSTSFDCSPSLKEIYPSCGGDASEANIKVLTRYEFITGSLEPLALLSGKRSDQGLALQTADLLKAGQLQIQDKGFYAAAGWRAAQQRGAFLLCPLPRSNTLWLTDHSTGAQVPLDLASVLAHATVNQIEWQGVLVGKNDRQVGPLRILAFRLSPASASRHRANLREACRRHGKVPTRQALELAGWLILATNAPEHKLPSAIVSYLYRVRWQVELIFRQLKSVLRLDKSESANPHRVQCEIWARLIFAITIFLWHAHANAQCWLQHRSEVSFEKLCRLVQQWAHTLVRAMLVGKEAFLNEFRTVWRNILANARKGRQKTRTNTWDYLYEGWLKA